MSKEQDTRSEDQARAKLAWVKELIEALHLAQDGSEVEIEGYTYDEDGVRDLIYEDALSVEVRSGWHAPGGEAGGDADGEYRICLCTGGPAVQITGELGQYGEPESARIEHQDWFTPWTALAIDSEDEAALIEYASHFLGM